MQEDRQMLRSTKIVATLGPASSDRAMIARLFDAGVDVFRINMSHTPHDKLREMVIGIQASAEQVGRSAEQLAHTSASVAAASAQQSEATSATAAAGEEMTVGIESIAQSANSAQTFSQDASALSRKGGEVIHGGNRAPRARLRQVRSRPALL